MVAAQLRVARTSGPRPLAEAPTPHSADTAQSHRSDQTAKPFGVSSLPRGKPVGAVAGLRAKGAHLAHGQLSESKAYQEKDSPVGHAAEKGAEGSRETQIEAYRPGRKRSGNGVGHAIITQRTFCSWDLWRIGPQTWGRRNDCVASCAGPTSRTSRAMHPRRMEKPANEQRLGRGEVGEHGAGS